MRSEALRWRAPSLPALPDLVVGKLPHEDVAVDGLAGVIETAVDAERVAELRALPRHDDERLRCLLVAEDRDAGQRLGAAAGSRLRLRARRATIRSRRLARLLV